MNQIINGKKYDTETAKKIGRYADAWHDYFEELYVKSTGEFFLFMPVTSGVLEEHINELDANRSLSIAPVLYPLSKDAAKEWVSKVMDADTYENLFGEVAE